MSALLIKLAEKIILKGVILALNIYSGERAVLSSATGGI